MSYHLEDTVELVKYCQTARGLKTGSGVSLGDAENIRIDSEKLKEAIEERKPEDVILYSCETVFDALSALHFMGYDTAEFNSVFRDYVDYKFAKINDAEATAPDFRYDIPTECVFSGEEDKETVKGPYHKDNLPDFDDLIGNVIAKRKEAESE